MKKRRRLNEPEYSSYRPNFSSASGSDRRRPSRNFEEYQRMTQAPRKSNLKDSAEE